MILAVVLLVSTPALAVEQDPAEPNMTPPPAETPAAEEPPSDEAPPMPEEEPITYPDLTEDAWYYAAVSGLTEAGVNCADPSGSVNAAGYMSRYDLLALLNRALAVEVDEGVWQTRRQNHLNAAVAAGLAAEGQFTLETLAQPVNRFELALLLSNALTVRGEAVEESLRAKLNFRDYAAIPVDYQAGVTVCYELGLLNSNGTGLFRGWDSVTRGEAIVALWRLLDPSSRATRTPLPDADTYISKQALLTLANDMAGAVVDAGDWQTAGQNQIDSAVALGLVTAEQYTKATLAQTVNRLEVARLAAALLTRLEGEMAVEGVVASVNITDYGSIPADDRTAVNLCVMTGLIPCKEDGSFGVWDTLTAGQVYDVLLRVADKTLRQPPVFDGFTKVLTSHTTEYYTSSDNRCFNIAKATDAITETILLPGQVFDFNATVGNPGKNEGYLLAGIINNGKSALGYGGGVCQVTTTLYIAALEANMTILERNNHALISDYAAPGWDAAVYYPTLNLRFSNPYSYPVKLVGVNENKTLTFYLLAAENAYLPEVEFDVTWSGGRTYTMTRTADGVENLVIKSTYK